MRKKELKEAAKKFGIENIIQNSNITDPVNQRQISYILEELKNDNDNSAQDIDENYDEDPNVPDEEGEGIGGGPWILINRKLMGDREFMTPMPRFLNYDQLEQLLANVLQLWEDFKYELCASKGIAYERKDVLALENMYLATEERDLDEIR